MGKQVESKDVWQTRESVDRHFKDVVDKAYIVIRLPRKHPERMAWSVWCLNELLRIFEWRLEHKGDDDEHTTSSTGDTGCSGPGDESNL